MSDPTYINITESAFRSKLEGEMGFSQTQIRGTAELVFERPIVLGGEDSGYTIRVYSSVAGGSTRDVGEDAIRVLVVNNETGRPVRLHGEKKGSKIGKRINRTAPNGIAEEKRVATLLGRVRDRCAEFWALVRDNRCPKCGHVMAKRKGKHGEFKGCTNYPECTHTEN